MALRDDAAMAGTEWGSRRSRGPFRTPLTAIMGCAALAALLLVSTAVSTVANGSAEAVPRSSDFTSPLTPGGTIPPSSARSAAPAVAGSSLQPIAKGDIIASLYNANQVNEYTPSGTLVQTLLTANTPTGLAFDGAGNLFVTEFTSDDILELNASTLTVSVFSSDATLNDGTSYNAPESIAFGPGFTKMYVSDANRNGPGGGIHVVNAASGAGDGFYSLPSSSGSEGTGESDWLAFNHSAKLFMTNEDPSQGIMQVDQTAGDVIQPSFVPNLPDVGYALSFDKNDNVWVGDTSAILEYGPSGALLNTITNAAFSSIFSATFDTTGNTFYAGDLGTGDIYTYSLDGMLQGSFNTGSGVSGLAVAGAVVAPPPPTPTVADVNVAQFRPKSEKHRWRSKRTQYCRKSSKSQSGDYCRRRNLTQ